MGGYDGRSTATTMSSPIIITIAVAAPADDVAIDTRAQDQIRPVGNPKLTSRVVQIHRLRSMEQLVFGNEAVNVVVSCCLEHEAFQGGDEGTCCVDENGHSVASMKHLVVDGTNANGDCGSSGGGPLLWLW